MAKVGILWETADFLVGLGRAIGEMNGDGERILHEVGSRVVARAKAHVARLKQPDPRYQPGELAASIDMRSGKDAQGPWLEVGTDERYAIFVEYGTYKDRAQPFMRPALSLAARAIRSSPGRVARLQSPRARLFAQRAAKRAGVRRALRRGQITAAQARAQSRQISSSFRFRARRRR